MGSMPSTIIASSSSRIRRAPQVRRNGRTGGTGDQQGCRNRAGFTNDGEDRRRSGHNSQAHAKLPGDRDISKPTEPCGGVTPFARHQAPAASWPRRGRPSEGSICAGIGGKGGISMSASDASSSASFSSLMPIGPTRWALRNWATTGSSLVLRSSKAFRRARTSRSAGDKATRCCRARSVRC